MSSGSGKTGAEAEQFLDLLRNRSVERKIPAPSVNGSSTLYHDAKLLQPGEPSADSGGRPDTCAKQLPGTERPIRFLGTAELDEYVQIQRRMQPGKRSLLEGS